MPRFGVLESGRVNAEIGGGFRQDLEQTLGAGETDPVRIETAFLVHLGDDQPPIEPRRLGRRPDDVVIRRQRVSRDPMLALARHPARIDEVFVAQHVEFVAPVAFTDERIETAHEFLVVVARRPGEPLLGLERKAQGQAWIECRLQLCAVAVDQRGIEAAPGDIRENRAGRPINECHIEARLGANALQRCGIARPRVDRDPSSGETGEIGDRFAGGDKRFAYPQVRAGKAQTHLDAVVCRNEARGDHVAATRREPIEQAADVARDDHFQLEVMRRGEGADQLVFEAEQLAAPEVIGGRRVDSEHPDAASRDDGIPVAEFLAMLLDRMAFQQVRVEHPAQYPVFASQRPRVVLHFG